MKIKSSILSACAGALALSGAALADDDDPAVALLDSLNLELAASGSNLSIFSMEMIGSGEGNAMGRTVRASDHGNKQLGTDWSPVDPNRGMRTNITHMIDDVDTTLDIPASEQDDVARESLEQWDEQQCSNIGIDELPTLGGDLGFVQLLVGFGGSAATATGAVDILHGGFLPQPFWDIIACGVPGSGCGDGILGVNFTFTYVGGQDSDGNGRNDTALRENYYNDEFDWVNDGVSGERGEGVFDFYSVALHENGHALSRAHFGDIAIHHKKGLTASPKAVMNAIYGGVERDLRGPDNGGHCSDWSAWPTQN